MDDEGNRQAAVADGLDLDAPNAVVVGATEAELLQRHRVQLREQLAIDRCQLRYAPGGIDAVEIVRRNDTVHGRDCAAARERMNIVEVALAGQPGNRAGRRIDPEYRMLEHV